MTSESSSVRASEDVFERDRKAEHIHLALRDRMQLGSRYFDDFSFEHVALPEIDRRDVDTSVEFLGKRLRAPLLISCMTGGTDMAAKINRNLARAAEATGIAVGVGSQRKAIEDASLAATFSVRELAPSVPLLANLGAVQLNYGFGVAECEAAVAMIDADALVLHINPLQEAIQPEGQCDFGGLLAKIAELARGSSVPLIAKEVGYGISRIVGEKLLAAGVKIVDTAGSGGTSWSRIEGARAGDVEIGDLFADWGIPTPECIRQLAAVPGLTVIGSGGVRNGVDVAKAIALGADVVGMAFPFLKAAMESADAVAALIERAIQELTICMFCVGAPTVADLRAVELLDRQRR